MRKIHSVHSVTLAVLDTNPRRLLITAVGQVVSSGWNDPELIEYSSTHPPADGLINFDFLASPPAGTALPALFPILVQRIWEGDLRRLRGVRVHAAANQAEMLLPARVNLQPALRDFSEIDSLAGREFANGLPESALLPPRPAESDSPQEEQGILLGGSLQAEPSISGEGTGLFLCDVMVEVDAQRVPEAEKHQGALAVVEGKFELKSYPRRGKVWTFVASHIRPHKG